ncbi:MAG: hypothetical protein WC748_08080 [Legionellales bacterium]|jgi:hypothetical protein
MLTQIQLDIKLKILEKLPINKLQSICKELQNNTLVTTLDLRKFKLSALNQKEVGKALSSLLSMWTQDELNNYLQNLEELTIDDFKFICEELQNNTNVTDVDFTAFSFDALDQEEVGQTFYALLSKNTKITNLNLDSTEIDEQVISCIARAIKDNNQTAITNLNLKGGINYEKNNSEIDHDIELLLTCGSIRHLNLAFQSAVDANTAKIIGQSLLSNEHLESLVLPIIDNDFAHIFEALEKNITLKRLDMSNGTMSNSSMHSLKRLLEKNQHIVSLIFASINKGICHLDEQGISVEGLNLLCEGLKKNSHVTELDFSDCNITDEKLRLICDLIKNSDSRVAKINLSGHALTAHGLRLFLAELKGNTKEVEICMSDINKLPDINIPSNFNETFPSNKEQSYMIDSINAGIDAGTRMKSTFKSIDNWQVLDYYLKLARDRIDDGHPGKAKIIKKIEDKIAVFSNNNPGRLAPM